MRPRIILFPTHILIKDLITAVLFGRPGPLEFFNTFFLDFRVSACQAKLHIRPVYDPKQNENAG